MLFHAKPQRKSAARSLSGRSGRHVCPHRLKNVQNPDKIQNLSLYVKSNFITKELESQDRIRYVWRVVVHAMLHSCVGIRVHIDIVGSELVTLRMYYGVCVRTHAFICACMGICMYINDACGVRAVASQTR